MERLDKRTEMVSCTLCLWNSQRSNETGKKREEDETKALASYSTHPAHWCRLMLPKNNPIPSLCSEYLRKPFTPCSIKANLFRNLQPSKNLVPPNLYNLICLERPYKPSA